MAIMVVMAFADARPSRDGRLLVPGEELQLYTGMRTKSCQLIGRATCTAVSNIAIRFHEDRAQDAYYLDGSRHGGKDLDAFAISDGFESWRSLRAFGASTMPA